MTKTEIELRNLVAAILLHRDKVFIPEENGPELLRDWTERATEAYKNSGTTKRKS